MIDYKTIVQDIDALTETYCEDCLIKKQLRKEKNKAYAHNFCLEKCTVGEQLRFLGRELMKIETRKDRK